MLISKQWLEDFVDIPTDITPEQLASDLTLHTVEVEGVESPAALLENVVVGVVKEVKKHPDADKLRVCSVDIGDMSEEVVCGGINLKDGMKVAFGKVGARVRWHGEGDLVELKPAKIRGVESRGMICASDEIGLGELFPKSHEAEILDISHIDTKAGTSLADVLGTDDVMLDIDNKSMTHRPDLWGHYGMAREVAALYEKSLKPYAPPEIKPGNEMQLDVDIEAKDLCARYCGVVMDGIVMGPSPEWMQERLIAVGVRPISVLVDITNYVMFELGQPMHAFDAEKLSVKNNTLNIVVRRAKDGEELTTLDDQSYELTDDMLVIADRSRADDLAGVMGGAHSQISNTTTRALFEAANFDAITTRKTAATLGKRTDASTRFEKSLDPHMPPVALRRAVELVKQIFPEARVISNVADVSYVDDAPEPIDVSLAYLQKKIGVNIEKKDVVRILESLGFVVESGHKKLFGRQEPEDVLHVRVPTWRATKDVNIVEDVIEEVARIYGYGNIPTALPQFSISPAPVNVLRELEHEIKQTLAYECGFTETRNYSFVAPEWVEKFGLSLDHYIELDNPVAKDRPFVRRHLLPNMVHNVEENLHRYDSVGLFEVGRTYVKEGKGVQAQPDDDTLLPKQDTVLGMVYAAKGNTKPFFEISGALQRVFERLNIPYELKDVGDGISFYHPTRSTKIIVRGQEVGNIGELHPRVQKICGIPYHVGILELCIDGLVLDTQTKASYVPLPEYPSTSRDVALVVDRNIAHKDLKKVIEKQSPLVVRAALFDVYEGSHIDEGKKSLAYSIEYRSEKKTLEAEEVDALHAKIVETVKKKFDASVRE